MKNKIFFSVILFFLPTILLANYDRDYILKYDSDVEARIFMSKMLASLKIKDHTGKYEYQPNKPTAFGVGLSLGSLSLNLGYGFEFLKDKDKGDTKGFGLQAHYYIRNFVFGAFLQRYEGFYLKGYTQDKNSIRSDIKVGRIGIHGEYLFNGRRFSLSSSAGQKEQQIKSAGSFQAGLGIYYDKVSSNRVLFPATINEAADISNVQFGPTIGYGYNFLIRENFFIMLSLSLGTNISFEIYNSKKSGMRFYPSINPKFAIGYNEDSWGLNLSFIANETDTLKYNDRSVKLGTSEIMLSFFKRFDRLSIKLPEKNREVIYESDKTNRTDKTKKHLN